MCVRGGGGGLKDRERVIGGASEGGRERGRKRERGKERE